MTKVNVDDLTQDESVVLFNELLSLIPFDVVRNCICDSFESEYLRELISSMEDKADELDAETEGE